MLFCNNLSDHVFHSEEKNLLFGLSDHRKKNYSYTVAHLPQTPENSVELIFPGRLADAEFVGR